MSAAMDQLEGGGPTQEIRQPVRYLDPRLKAAPYVVNPATGDRTPGAVFQATDALESLVPAAGSPEPGETGLWLPDSVATRLHLAAGDPVGLQLAVPGSDPAPVMATVTGVYVTDPDGAPEDPSGLWGRIIDQLPIWPSHLVPTTPQLPLLVADIDTYRAMVKGIRETTLVTWDVAPDADPLRLADLQRLDDSVEALRDELADSSSDFSEQVTHRGNIRVTLSTGLPDMIGGDPRRAARDPGRRRRRARPRRGAVLAGRRPGCGRAAGTPPRRAPGAGRAGPLRGGADHPEPRRGRAPGRAGAARRVVGQSSVRVRHRGCRRSRASTAGRCSRGRRRARHGGRGLGRRCRGPAPPGLGPSRRLGQPGPVAQRRAGPGRRRSDHHLPRGDRVRRDHGGVPARGGGRRGDHRLDAGHLAVGAAGPTVAATPAGSPAHPVPAGAGPGLGRRVPRGDGRLRSRRLRIAVPRLRGRRDHGQDRDHGRRQQRLRRGRPGGGRRARRGHRPVDGGAPHDPADQRLHGRPAVRGGHRDVRAGGALVAAVRRARPVRPAR